MSVGGRESSVVLMGDDDIAVQEWHYDQLSHPCNTECVYMASRLVDHRVAQEEMALRHRQRRLMPPAFGEFISKLAEWDWFVNPISFRDDWRNAFRPTNEPSLREGPPSSAEALSHLGEYFAEIERAAEKPIGWVIGEEFGSLGGRYHCHALLTGVSHLWRGYWWSVAFQKFGITRIEPFDRDRGAAFYAAKYAAKQLGGLHFGGTLAGVRLSDLELPRSPGGRQTAIPSVEMEADFYGRGLRRWHR
jgi:hypothetical protein